MILPEEVLTLAEKFNKAGYKLYTVGGAVRDLLLGREIKDWDFTTDAVPEKILKIVPEGFYNNQFGTVGVQSSVLSSQLSDTGSSDISQSVTEKQKADRQETDNIEPRTDSSIFEITTMRKESKYDDFRRPSELEWTTDINEDLKRRDFTINALALELGTSDKEQGTSKKQDNIQSLTLDSCVLSLLDPFNGQQDLQNKLIRAVGDPKIRFFEDGLRLIRAVRFAAQLGFKIEENTFNAIKENADLIKKISWERIRDELFKILSSDNAYEGIILLREVGLLMFILPEVERCFGVQQEGPKHDREYDIGEHSFLALKFCPSQDPLVRLAALIHDIGKPDTVNIQKDGNVTFYGHDVVGGRLAKEIAKRLRLSNKETDKIIRLVRYHMFTVSEHQTDSAIRRFIKNVGLENIDDMMAVRIGDRLGGGTEKEVSWRMEEFRKRINQVLEKPFSLSDLKVDGTDVMEITGLKPGREVGDILQKLFQEVLEDASKNEREYLLKKIKEII